MPVSTRVSPALRLRAEIGQVFAERGTLAVAIEQVARLGLELTVERETCQFLLL